MEGIWNLKYKIFREFVALHARGIKAIWTSDDGVVIQFLTQSIHGRHIEEVASMWTPKAISVVDRPWQ